MLQVECILHIWLGLIHFLEGWDDYLSKFFREIPTDQFILSLYDSDLEVRARAAGVLGNRPEKGVPDSLPQVARTDKSLRVACNALFSFGYIRLFQYLLVGIVPRSIL
jgi:hypothetical protein